ncbi:MAG TPA: helix-turn-helix domain-containing protein [Syntrophales bacterium]|nr:helix-turn-helix domain-containing protein [Syntrophales bacterium]HPI57247.1 helix-turn-helix domain-containing protein [Syntrophales bacterium]HPN25636.1 helix-turn-helix domain-containing protein [Syntrophales bacterium]HQM28106.1 helix-turn-helix domain-containing protein [Syntrophales bacterium]
MEKLYTVEETRQALKISRGTLYALIKGKKIKPVKLGGRTLFTETELANFIERLKKVASEPI